ncbi:SUMO-targeted ubiquitin-protein ligase E3 Slx8 [Schizosaccharomyces japonicus yFS275]|uniref:SUMO-targeted ubiquitin-protein ligase E3 Slx8 n=1 Tax=Schizosaccharomyces japonicus (strain yFS275 / FY16936) TaxID=402676 RepID=B6K235_SCHJY|nr:SUMO-targeted ubiquitin-protein ligase E3 Slx8 [Schizosaccharomyces japonicus yFS275]EEB07216.1 SUMO-targeted ubiquitin-protein ligase E3 Slx8 [Schizosaccharomyces japonicus yFS275]
MPQTTTSNAGSQSSHETPSSSSGRRESPASLRSIAERENRRLARLANQPADEIQTIVDVPSQNNTANGDSNENEPINTDDYSSQILAAAEMRARSHSNTRPWEVIEEPDDSLIIEDFGANSSNNCIDLTKTEKSGKPKRKRAKTTNKKKETTNVGGDASSKPPQESRKLADYTCAICLDSPENLAATPCGHIFCDFCIRSALGKTPATQKCPVCRRKVLPKSIICLEMMLGKPKTKTDNGASVEPEKKQL